LLVSGNLNIANSKGVDVLSMKAVNLQGVEIFHLSDFLLLDDSRCIGWFGKKSTGNKLIVDNDIGPESEFVMHARVSQRDDDGLEAENISTSNAEDWFLDVHKSVRNNQVGQVGFLRWRASGLTQDKTVLGFTPVELVR
jgi:hypothetical protein